MLDLLFDLLVFFYGNFLVSYFLRVLKLFQLLLLLGAELVLESASSLFPLHGLQFGLAVGGDFDIVEEHVGSREYAQRRMVPDLI